MADVNSYVIPGLNATAKRTLEDGGVSVSLTHAELRMIGRMPADQQDAAALAQLQDKLARKQAKLSNGNEPGIVPAYPLEQVDGKWTERTDKQHIGAKLNGPGFGRRGTVVNRKKHDALKALYSNSAEVAKIEAILATAKE